MKGSHSVTVRQGGVLVCRVGGSFIVTDFAKGGIQSTFIYEEYQYIHSFECDGGYMTICMDQKHDIWFTFKVQDIMELTNVPNKGLL